MKRILLLVILPLCFSQSAKARDILGGGKGLACEAIICAIGVAIPESHAKCTQVLTEWSIYLATLGPFSSKPKCPKKDSDNNTIGYLEMDCNAIQHPELKQQCLNAQRLPNDCSGYLGTPEYPRCEFDRCNRKRRNGERVICHEP